MAHQEPAPDLLPVVTTTAAETEALGRRLAARLAPGDVVALYGDLGAGKTHLAKGICAALGVAPEAVTSPTFALVHEYAADAFPVFHIDAYRLERLDEFFALGYEEYFYGDGLCLVEWPEKVEALLPASTFRLRLDHLGGDRRAVSAMTEDETPDPSAMLP